MNEIRFVERLGDELQRVAARHGAVATGRTRWRLTSGVRMRVVIGLAVLAGGGAATASVLSERPVQRAAINGIACIAPNGNGTFDVFGVSPTQACRGAFRAHTPLVACISHYGLVIVLAREHGGQCARHGYRPLPRSYGTYVRRVDSLVRAMVPIGIERNCWSRAGLADRIDRLLAERGFAGWRADYPADEARISTTGPCALVGWNGSGSVGDVVYGLLNPQQRTVSLRTGGSLAARRSVYAIWRRFGAHPGCSTVGSLESRLQTLSDAARLSPSIVVTRAKDAGQFSYLRIQAQLYRAGCAFLAGAGIGPDGRTLRLWILQRAAPPPHRLAAVPDDNPYDGPPFALPPQRP